MNCGMEDVVVLDEMMRRHPGDRLAAFNAYSTHRNPDAEAMCDLAMYNYVEMRDLVARPTFLMRKRLDNLLYWLMPATWVPLYTSVTFSRIRYSKCISNKKWQDDLLTKVIYYTTSGAGCLAAVAGFVFLKQHAGFNATTLSEALDNMTGRIFNKLLK